MPRIPDRTRLLDQGGLEPSAHTFVRARLRLDKTDEQMTGSPEECQSGGMVSVALTQWFVQDGPSRSPGRYGRRSLLWPSAFMASANEGLLSPGADQTSNLT